VKLDAREFWPKGSPAPAGYVAWHEWAEAQYAHGLKQTQCPCCKLWFFPQESHAHSASEGQKQP
jgi:hypothetical protein